MSLDFEINTIKKLPGSRYTIDCSMLDAMEEIRTLVEMKYEDESEYKCMLEDWLLQDHENVHQAKVLASGALAGGERHELPEVIEVATAFDAILKLTYLQMAGKLGNNEYEKEQVPEVIAAIRCGMSDATDVSETWRN